MAFFCTLHLLTIGGQWSMVNQMAQREFFFLQLILLCFWVRLYTRFASPNPPPKRQKKNFHGAFSRGQDPFSDVNFVKAFLKIPSSHH